MTNQLSDADIMALGPGLTVEGFDQLWRAIGRLPFMSNDGPYAWRGVSDSRYELRSSLYRKLYGDGSQGNLNEKDIRETELAMLAEARDWGLGKTGYTEISDLQLLAVLQHHGSPTRLVDVTSNPLTALWFACSGNPDVDGLLMAFNLSSYPVLQAENNQPTYGSMSDPRGWHLENSLVQSQANRLPMVLRPNALDLRMAAQEGFFLLSACPPPSEFEYREVPRPVVDGIYLRPSAYVPYGAAESMLFEDDPIMKSYPQALWAFRIPPEIKAEVLGALDVNFNKNAQTLFPDAAGFAAYSKVCSGIE